MKDHLSDVVASTRHAFSIDTNRDCFDFFSTEVLLVADPEEIGTFCLIIQSPAVELTEDGGDFIKLYHDEIMIFDPENFESLIKDAEDMYGPHFEPYISDAYRQAFGIYDEDYTTEDLLYVLAECIRDSSMWILDETEYIGFIIED